MPDHLAHRAFADRLHRAFGRLHVKKVIADVVRLDLPKHREIDVDDVLVAGQHQGFLRHVAHGAAAAQIETDVDLVDAQRLRREHSLDRVGQVIIAARAAPRARTCRSGAPRRAHRARRGRIRKSPTAPPRPPRSRRNRGRRDCRASARATGPGSFAGILRDRAAWGPATAALNPTVRAVRTPTDRRLDYSTALLYSYRRGAAGAAVGPSCRPDLAAGFIGEWPFRLQRAVMTRTRRRASALSMRAKTVF